MRPELNKSTSPIRHWFAKMRTGRPVDERLRAGTERPPPAALGFPFCHGSRIPVVSRKDVLGARINLFSTSDLNLTGIEHKHRTALKIRISGPRHLFRRRVDAGVTK